MISSKLVFETTILFKLFSIYANIEFVELEIPFIWFKCNKI